MKRDTSGLCKGTEENPGKRESEREREERRDSLVASKS
jgi:hypothetical protein